MRSLRVDHISLHLFCKILKKSNLKYFSRIELFINQFGQISMYLSTQLQRQLKTQLSDFTLTFHFHALEKEMATHSSVLAWRIRGTGEPGGLPSMGLHRVGHDWSDLAAAACIYTSFHCLQSFVINKAAKNSHLGLMFSRRYFWLAF